MMIITGMFERILIRNCITKSNLSLYPIIIPRPTPRIRSTSVTTKESSNENLSPCHRLAQTSRPSESVPKMWYRCVSPTLLYSKGLTKRLTGSMNFGSCVVRGTKIAPRISTSSIMKPNSPATFLQYLYTNSLNGLGRAPKCLPS